MTQVTTIRLAGRGKAVGWCDGETWLVAGALPGETVEASVEGRRAGVVEARAVSIVASPHPSRKQAPCRHAESCGGCDWPHVRASQGSMLKAEVAAGAARPHPELAELLAAADVTTSPLAYRLRARLHWQPDHRRLGFYRQRSWETVPIPDCRILSPRLMAIRERLEDELARTCPSAVDVEWLEDLKSEQAIAALRRARQGEQPDGSWLPAESVLTDTLGGFNILAGNGRRLSGWGEKAVTMGLPRPLEVPIGSFFQGNRHLVPWLYDRIAQLVGRDPQPVWDLHAGVGLLAAAALTAAPRQLTAVEVFRPAAHAAVRNLPEARVAVGQTAESFLARHRKLPSSAIVITDPPRAGLTQELRNRLAGWNPERIIMLGCDPATWARDAAFLLEKGYEITHLELIDLFPSTHHVEVLAVLEPR